MSKKLLAIIVAITIVCTMLLGCEKSSSSVNTSEPPKSTETANNNTDKATNSTAGNNDQQYIQVPVTIINGTDINFAKIYASGVNVDTWGSNLLDNGITFAPGDAINITFNIDSNNLKWDFKAVDYNGNYLDFNGLDL